MLQLLRQFIYGSQCKCSMLCHSCCIRCLFHRKMSNIPAGDPAKGAKIFKQRCAQCHTTEKVSPTIHLFKAVVYKLADLKF